MEKEKRYLLKGGISYNDEPKKNTIEINPAVLGLGFYETIPTGRLKNELADLTEGIEQEKAVKNYAIKAKQNEIDTLKKTRQLLNKQSRNTKELYNSLNRKDSDLTKINTKSTRKFNIEPEKQSINPAVRSINDENKVKNRADLLYGGTEYNNSSGNKKQLTEIPVNNQVNAPQNEFPLSELTFGDTPPQKIFSMNNIIKKASESEIVCNTVLDNISNFLVDFSTKNMIGIEATENLRMSMADSYMDTEYARNNLVFNNYLELNSDLQPYFKRKIAEQIGEDKLLTTKGIYIDAQSASSKRMASALVSNYDFIKELYENRRSLDRGLHINTSIQFNDRNFHSAIGNADILDMHINKNGEIDMLVTDVYDFNDNETLTLIREARKRQLAGEIIPYFIIYHVIIPKTAGYK